ncbi:MAG: hypothetical protein R3C05_31300, partial [Pirellulaceae bacterium]
MNKIAHAPLKSETTIEGQGSLNRIAGDLFDEPTINVRAQSSQKNAFSQQDRGRSSHPLDEHARPMKSRPLSKIIPSMTANNTFASPAANHYS